VFSVENTFLCFVSRLFPNFLAYEQQYSSSAPETPLSALKKRGKHCAVFGCNNSYYDNKGLFFNFPTNPKRRNRWCNLIKWQHGKDKLTVTSATVVCHEHFRQDDIAIKLSGHWDLKKGL